MSTESVEFICARDRGLCRQDTDDAGSHIGLQAQLEQLQDEKSDSAQSFAITQNALVKAENEIQRLQQNVQELQRHTQDRGYKDLQARFKEVSFVARSSKSTKHVNLFFLGSRPIDILCTNMSTQFFMGICLITVYTCI